MKITINKEYTLASQLDAINKKARYFKAVFTEGDLLRMFNETTGADIHGEIIKCTIEAFASNHCAEDASFQVEMVVDCSISFHRLRFYVNEQNGVHAVDANKLARVHEVYPFGKFI